MAKCKSCDAEIEWAVLPTGKRIPVDAERVAGGNIVLVHTEVGKPPMAEVCTKERLATIASQHESNLARGLDDGSDRLYVSHFATCPDAAQHRKR